MEHDINSLPELPTVRGARYVSVSEATQAYRALGFKLPHVQPRCFVPSDTGPGAVFAWSGHQWTIECGGLTGRSLREWRRYEKDCKTRRKVTADDLLKAVKAARGEE